MGLTNAEVARLAKLDPQTVGDFFAGRRWPRPKTLAKLEQVLDLAPGQLAVDAEGLEMRIDVQEPRGFSLEVILPDYIKDAGLSESQIDYMRTAAQMGALRAFADIVELRANRVDVSDSK